MGGQRELVHGEGGQAERCMWLVRGRGLRRWIPANLSAVVLLLLFVFLFFPAQQRK